jgi:hypothetical protein
MRVRGNTGGGRFLVAGRVEREVHGWRDIAPELIPPSIQVAALRVGLTGPELCEFADGAGWTPWRSAREIEYNREHRLGIRCYATEADALQDAREDIPHMLDSLILSSLPLHDFTVPQVALEKQGETF